MILTPEQIAALDSFVEECLVTERWARNSLVDTLVAYAEIVQRVAEMEASEVLDREYDDCLFCGKTSSNDLAPIEEQHAPDCPYVAARKLRGLE